MSQLADFGRGARLLMLLDQGLYTGTNFLLAISLAAFVGIESLGHFALIISVSALLHSVFVGVVLEPLTVFGSAAKEERLRDIYKHFSAVISTVAYLLSGLLFAIGTATEMNYVVDAALGFAIFGGQGAVLCNKRSLQMLGKVDRSVRVSLRYFLGACLVTAYALLSDRYDEYSVVVALIAGSILASGGWWIRSLINGCTLGELREVIARVRKYTTWTVVTSVPATLSLYGIYWIAEFTSTREVVGLLKLFEQLITPFLQVAMTMSMLDQIESAREYESADAGRVTSRLSRRTTAYSKLAASYVSILLLGVVAYQWADNGDVSSFMPALVLYCVIPFLYAYSIPRNVAAKACRKPELNAFAYTGMALTVILGGAVWQPAQLIELVGLLVLGWIVNTVILKLKVAELLGKMRHAY